MSVPAVRVSNLGKQYHLGTAGPGYTTLRDSVRSFAGASLRTLLRRGRQAERKPTFWALQDVSFEIQPGEVVGIIGRNGAGKSTLLKILSRITEPTRGEAEIRGRVGSLLEVGTGFHPELTGRENIFLNGAILGMRRSEILKNFDQIVAFAEVEKFIDTPVKHYSSGMYMRLAFAVAAHLETEILIVDEVLAVGDAEFQKKCLGKMGDVAKQGRTVLFVSHNMAAVRQLCSSAILVQSGRVAMEGAPNTVIKAYVDDIRTGQQCDLRQWRDRDPGSGKKAQIVECFVADTQGTPVDFGVFGNPIRLIMTVEFHEAINLPTFGFIIHLATGEPILDLRSVHGPLPVEQGKGTLRIEALLSNVGLYPGDYTVSPWVADSSMQINYDWPRQVCGLTVAPAAESTWDLQRASAWGKYWVPTTWSIKQSPQKPTDTLLKNPNVQR